MSELTRILKKLSGTREAEIIAETEKSYGRIFEAQRDWYEKSNVSCPKGCGKCCETFEPDLLECEALYMAAWLLENQYDTAVRVSNGEFPFENEGCLFFNKNSPYHCSIYGGRAFICRLFGASGFRSKDGLTAWKPCRFYPAEKSGGNGPRILHRQYSEEELLNLFGTTPPVMSDFTEQIIGTASGSAKTSLIREILPGTIKRLLWLCLLNGNNDGNDTPTPSAA